MLIKIDFLLFLFKPNKFLPNILIINAVGVTTTKKTMPITIGDIKFPNKTPNLNQILFKGFKIDASLREHYFHNGKYYSSHILSLLKKEYE